MEVIIRPSADAASRLVASLIGDTLDRNPVAVLGLATGRTVVPVYNELARLHRDEGLDFSNCRTFNLDEYVGLSPDDPDSFRHTMDVRLFNRVNIKRENTHVPNGVAKDLDAECLAYEQRIRDFGGIDFQLLGIGDDGHIGFNEPLSALRSRTRVKAIAPDTLRQNSEAFSSPESMPRRGITMGVGTILDSRHCVLLATGEAKALILAKAVEGPITAMISATALQLHPKCQVIVDEAAASQLEGTDYYQWIFENEPEWEAYRNDE
jgi:glucosamine-6-phosphate deaminase